VFDSDPAELTIDAAARLVAEQHRVRVVAECRLLELAAQWADLHSAPPDPAVRDVAGEGLRTPGGAGTPGVLEFAAAELGAHLETTTYAAWELMGDALDLRHRLPRLWAAVRAGHVRVWKARKVAHATRHLSPGAAVMVDAAIDGLINSMSWARFSDVLTAKVAESDPASEEARAAAYEAEQFVRGGRTTENGLKLVIARAAAGDVIWFLATVTRIAEILGAEGDRDPLDVRRSKAIGILSRPDGALELLRRHSGAGQPGSDSEPDPEEDGHLSLGTAQGVVLDPAASRPRVEIVVHVSAEALECDGGPVRMEGVGPLVLGQVRRWLASADCAGYCAQMEQVCVAGEQTRPSGQTL